MRLSARKHRIGSRLYSDKSSKLRRSSSAFLRSLMLSTSVMKWSGFPRGSRTSATLIDTQIVWPSLRI